MNPTERRAVFSLASIFALRMFGLFLLLPILAIHAEKLDGATPFYVGVAMGIYGLTQALLQIPYGLASDRLGRKKIITLGLLVFMLGSVIAALSESLISLIVGRALQGAGAVSSAILALTADLTEEKQRTKSMAIIGISIGFTFLSSLVLAPALESAVGVSGIFWIISFFSFIGIVVLYGVVPNARVHETHLDILPVSSQLRGVLKNTRLLALDIGILCLHMVLTAVFVVLPMTLVSSTDYPLSQHWKLYGLVLLCSVPGMIPFVIFGARANTEQKWFRFAIALLSIGCAVLVFNLDNSLIHIAISLIIFFSAFNALEAMLPSLISRIAPRESKGTAMGVYNSCQFMGMFLGGVGAGWMYGEFGAASVLITCSVTILLWLGITVYSVPQTEDGGEHPIATRARGQYR